VKLTRICSEHYTPLNMRLTDICIEDFEGIQHTSVAWGLHHTLKYYLLMYIPVSYETIRCSTWVSGGFLLRL